jgi:hypothetical protein
LESGFESAFQRISTPFHKLSTRLDRQVTDQYTTFQQLLSDFPQVIHSFFTRRKIATLSPRVSTISIPENLWQNLATAIGKCVLVLDVLGIQQSSHSMVSPD